MKNKILPLVSLVAAIALSGCIAFPPLIQVERKDFSDSNNDEVLRKLDSIEKRLDQLEKKPESK